MQGLILPTSSVQISIAISANCYMYYCYMLDVNGSVCNSYIYISLPSDFPGDGNRITYLLYVPHM